MINERFNLRLNNLSSVIWQKIAQIDELKGRWSAGVNLVPQILNQLKQSVLVTSSGASTRIEGAKLSDLEIEKMMKGINIKRFVSRDAQEVQGYFELLQNVFAVWQDLKFGESLIKHFHKELLKYVLKDEFHRGEYKKTENKVIMIDSAGKSVGTLFDTTPAFLTPKEMFEIIDWTKNELYSRKIHPLLIIGNFLVEFLNIHPFTDGNGRLSRILTNLLLLQAGYIFIPYVSHEKIIEENKTNYYLSLRASQKTIKTKNEKIEKWLLFFLNVVHTQAALAVNLLGVSHMEKFFSEKQQKVWEVLQKNISVSPKEIVGLTNINRKTVSQILNKLLKLKKIVRVGLGRATRYQVVK